MAKLEYDETGRLLFTKEMKEEYTILIPMMLPYHFTLMRNSLELDGYKVELLTTTRRNIVDEGLKNVHNDSCYPALLVVGQLIDALKSGKYDPHKTALIITQTGGGCRASNYIHLLRKALSKSGYDYVPVISLNLSGLEKNPGFTWNIQLAKRFVYSMLYGDILMLLANQCRPYEIEKGATDALCEQWMARLTEEYKTPRNLKYKHIKENLALIAQDFANLPVNRVDKVKVGVVGEIYVKFAPLGNNNLEKFLASEDCEVVVPGLMDFVIFKTDNRVVDVDLYGGSGLKRMAMGFVEKLLLKCQNDLIEVVSKHPQFRPPASFTHIKELVRGYAGYGNKMGEGWLLAAEMLELITTDIPNIVCTQPFGCLPNHIVGKGVIRKIKENYPQANIVVIDYDPGATQINQENRIKLMLANAKLAMQKKNG